MTNKHADRIANACDTLASRASNHLRVRTAVSEGKLDFAESLLYIRMERYILDYLENDLEDQEMIDAAELLNCLPGCISKKEMQKATHREIEKMDSRI